MTLQLLPGAGEGWGQLVALQHTSGPGRCSCRRPRCP